MTDPFQSIASYTRLESLLECIDDAAVLIDLDRTILAANQSFRSTFANDQDVRGRPCHAMCHGCARPCELIAEPCPMQECLTKRRPVQSLHVHTGTDGEVLTSVTMRPVADTSGKPDSVLEVLRPIEVASAVPRRSVQLHGRSLAFRSMLRESYRIAPTDKPVLLQGESGTDKEQVAKAIHHLSARSAGEFVPVDCATLKDWHFEKDFFGRRTPPMHDTEPASRGLVQAAQGGTLFLREIETLGPAAQVKLLRLLEFGILDVDGSGTVLTADFRLICSSSVDLNQAVDLGRFREDLRLHISSFPVRVSPLRDRAEDIPLLVDCAVRCLSCLPRCSQIHPETLDRLNSYPFPGNQRELRSIVERACLNAEGGVILPEHLPDEVRNRTDKPGTFSYGLRFDGEILPLTAVERSYIEWASQRLSSSRADLAERLGVSERTLYRKLSEPTDASLSQKGAERGLADFEPEISELDSEVDDERDNRHGSPKSRS